jgi:hypothetical protein
MILQKLRVLSCSPRFHPSAILTRASLVGDITPVEGYPKAEKQRLEAVRLPLPSLRLRRLVDLSAQEAMHNFVHEMLHDSPAAQRMEALWKVRVIVILQAIMA